MGFRAKNDRKRLAALTSVKARGSLGSQAHRRRGEFGPAFSALFSQTGRFASKRPNKPDLQIHSRQMPLPL
jgi:hypothetical protein